MSTISTFSGFTMARLGIMAASKALEVTGNNISNINTPGYTRQALDQRALYIGGADRYSSQFDVRVGSGALTTGVSQLRDPYLDIRYRNEAANVGFYTGKFSILQEISAIFDEVGKGVDGEGVLEEKLNTLLEQLQNLNTEHAGDKSYDGAVRGAALALVNMFHSYADKLEILQNDTVDAFKEDLGEVNNILQSIRELNESIKKAEISSGALADAQRKEGMIGERGQQALELRDERNKLIDQLANYLPIDVKYSDEPIGSGMTVEKLTITLAGNSDAVLIDGIYGGRLEVQQTEQPVLDENGNPKVDANGDPVMEKVDDPNFLLKITELRDRRGELIPNGRRGHDEFLMEDQTLVSGSLQAVREMLTKTGEYSTQDQVTADPKAATKRGIPYYQKALDALANKFASIFNEANNFTYDENKGPTEGCNWMFQYAADGTVVKDQDGKPVFKDEYKEYASKSGNLFSISGDSNDAVGPNGEIITAKNISISTGWAHETISIVQTKDENDMKWVDPNDETKGKVPVSTANTNIAHLITIMQKDHEFRPSDILSDDEADKLQSDSVFFTGSFQGMLTYVNGELASDTKSSGDIMDNFSLAALDLDLSRDSVSGVDLNDEAVNMMQYQKSYTAACRLLTTLDEILDKLINNTGLAGLR